MNIQIAKTALKEYFGYDAFRPMQADIIQNVYDKQDTLVLMPTGGGKSICYQIPAITLKGITIVVSPLIALMQDQVEGLKANGIEAAFLNSSQSYPEQKLIENDCFNGKIKLLYVSPEKLVSEAFTPILKMLPVNLIAIDEAHCISSWGHDFRPEYTKLKFLKQQLPHIPIIALTATADKTTRKDIIQQLNLGEAKQFVASFDRPNLSLTVKSGQKRFEQILDFLEDRPNTSGIIYCLSRKATESLAGKLKAKGYKAGFYHAGIPSMERAKVQRQFINDTIPIICATIAFGMGIDKSNVRWVIHYNMPKNMEAYYQEIGRAGRDGVKSDTVLFYSFADVMNLRKFAEDSGQRDLQLAKLDRMQEYAEAFICRRKMLLAYFNDNLEHDCGNCDVCKNPPQQFDGTIIAQKALSAVARLKQKVGMKIVIDVLRGSNRYDILSNNYHKVKTYGAGAEYSQQEWQQFMQQLIHLGYLDIAYDEKNALKINDLSKKVLFDGDSVSLIKLSDISKRKEKQKAEAQATTTSVGMVRERVRDELFEILRQLRSEIARDQGIPPYLVFSDATLEDMAANKPTTELEMLDVSGVGKFKMEKFGQPFIDKVEAYMAENNIEKTKIKLIKTATKKKPKMKRGETYQVTLQLYKQGLTPEQIAEQREISPNTIYSHLAKLYKDGENIQLGRYVKKMEMQQILDVIKGMDEPIVAKEVYEALKEELDYTKIRLTMAYYERHKR
ncbi:MAG: ATP-dependent DNA helicase RecQ [Saprospiraceae bacterium]|jgi:ATP-dependent DNA helicase RecQ